MNAKFAAPRSAERAFQIKDLICLVGVIGLLAVVQVSSLAGGRDGSQAEQCRNNLRRLTQAWLMYSDDNAGRLVPNHGSNPNSVRGTWVAGWLDWTSSFDNINTDYLVASEKTGKYGLLGPYVQRDVSVFRCPSDASTVQIGGRYYNRVRTVSMNNWMGGDAYCGQAQFYTEFRNQSEISHPSQRWVIAKELPGAINDSWFPVRMHQEYVVDYPAALHGGGDWFSFADGRVEFRRWVDSRTTISWFPGDLIMLNVPSPGNPDMAWLRERTTDKKPGAPL